MMNIAIQACWMIIVFAVSVKIFRLFLTIIVSQAKSQKAIERKKFHKNLRSDYEFKIIV